MIVTAASNLAESIPVQAAFAKSSYKLQHIFFLGIGQSPSEEHVLPGIPTSVAPRVQKGPSVLQKSALYVPPTIAHASLADDSQVGTSNPSHAPVY